MPAWVESQGEGVTVAVIDTGVDINHEDLKNNIWSNPNEIAGNGIDDDEDGYIDDVNGWNFCDNNNVVNTVGDEEHGTHVAGIIAAEKDNGIGIVGVAPKAKIMPLKVFKNGVAYTSDIINAIEYAEAHGAKIVNCSWGSNENNLALKEAIQNSGLLFICAVGNGAQNIDVNPIYPAAFDCENIISVASLSKNGVLSAFSNYGENSVDVAAPGDGIVSTLPGNVYGVKSGTSMAAAFVTGEIALLIPINNAMDFKKRIINSSDLYTELVNETNQKEKINCENAVLGLITNNTEEVNQHEIPSVIDEVYDNVYSYSLYEDNGIFDSLVDYRSIQGYNNWHYVEKTSGVYNDMHWDSTSNTWKGTYANCFIGNNYQHPDINMSARKWVAPYNGSIKITSSGNIRKSTVGGDGVNLTILQNNTALWQRYLEASNTTGIIFPEMNINVSTGDTIYFVVEQNGDIYFDGTYWSPIISYNSQYSSHQASIEFSLTQGQNNWYYMEKTNTGYNNMAWDATYSRWKGSYTYCLIWNNGGHPNTNFSARKWVAPTSGNIIISSNGNVRKDGIGGDGVVVKVLKNETILWEQYLNGTDSVGVKLPDQCINVVAGDAIYFIIEQYGDISYDSTIFDPVVTYTRQYNNFLEYIYDSNNRLTQILKNGQAILNFEYDQNGNLIRKY